jgi:hypothetical protein
MPDFLFTEFSSQNINSNTDLVLTSGRSTSGIGCASYVNDALATAALYAAHPRFVGQSANGRYFRALPVSGQLPVELGGAIGDGTSNDQPALQAAIAYAEAIGVRTLVFTAKAYQLRCPVRTGDPAGTTGEHLYDGRPLVVSSPLVMLSTCQTGTRLIFRHTDGGARQTSWQVVNSPSARQAMVWRGGGVFIKCPTSEPADTADRPGLSLIDMTLDGGIPQGSLFAFPARLSDGDGWDVTDKGIAVEPDRHSGDIRLIRSKVTGFRGELVYQAGLGNGELYIRSAVLSETNGALFQSCGSNLDIDGLLGIKGFACFEGWSGRRGRMVNTVFEDCLQTGGMAGGKLSSSANRNTPTRMADGLIPWLSLDAEFRNCGQVFLGSWIRGRVKLTDSPLVLDGSQVYGEGLQDVDLEVISQLDKATSQPAVQLLGSATPGKQTVSDVRIRLRCSRTAEARANGRVHLQPVEYRGSFGPNVFIERSSGESQRASGPSGAALTAVPDNFPCFRANVWHRTANDWAAINQDVSVTPQLVPRGDLMALEAPAPGTWPFSLPTSGIQPGHELTLGNISGAGVYFRLAATGVGASLPATRLLAPGMLMALRFDRAASVWREVAPPPPLKGANSLAFAAIAAGGVSPEATINCPGAEVGMTAVVLPTSDPGANFEICAIRVTAGAVQFRLRNNSAVAAAPATMVWSVTSGYPD